LLYVSVIGPGDGASEALQAAAREVGRLVAEAGGIVVTGGGSGVMAAATLGAGAAGGRTVALLPGLDRGSAAAPADVVIPTGLGELRNGLVVRAADVVIAVGGSWGTTSEIALAMRTGVPIVALSGWRYVEGDGDELEVHRASTPAEAVAAAKELAGLR
jgi:uncharacterized protein (TIGR00725 family)